MRWRLKMREFVMHPLLQKNAYKKSTLFILSKCVNNAVMKTIIRGFSKLILNQILPPVCSICRISMHESHQLCPNCWRDLHFVSAPICDVLGTPELPENVNDNAPYISLAAIAEPPNWHRARAATIYTGVARKCVYRLKYADDASVVQFMANAMHSAGKDILAQADILMPIPLHWSRFIKRHYNQSALLSKKLSEISGIAQNVNMLKRKKRTKSQVGLTRAQRRGNVEGAFEIAPRFKPLLKHKHVVLIDDVRTTGATLNEAAKALKKAGVKQVDVLTFAVLPNNMDDYREL